MTRAARIATLTTVLAATLALASRPAAGAPELAESEARALLREGNRLLKAGDAAGALNLYRSAWARFPSANVLLNVGTALLQLGREAEAAEAYDRYLGDPGADPRRRTEVGRILADLEARLGAVTVATDAGTSVRVDDRVVGEAPLPFSIHVAPGRHRVTAFRAGHRPAEAEIELAAGARRALELHPVPLPPDRRASVPATQPRGPQVAPPLAATRPVPVGPGAERLRPRPTPWYRRWWVWTIVGAVVVGGAVGAGVGVATAGGGDDVPVVRVPGSY